MYALAATATADSARDTATLQPRLVKASYEFEAQMMKELLKPMTGNSALTGEDNETDSDSGSNGALGEFASEALGKALSEQGGFGIASSILHDLSHSGNTNGSGKVTGKRHTNTVIRAAE